MLGSDHSLPQVNKMFCTSCGTKNNEDGNFCKQCGLKLDKPSHSKISELDFERAMPEDEQITSMLERAYKARKDGDSLGAIALCHEALALRPNSTSCHSLLGQLYEQGGERDLAIEQYERVLVLNPGSIADRVKLDELRGAVPSIVSAKKSHPHIVLADRDKNISPLDYRIPSFVLACVALMVLGGIFTMQMLTRQGSSQHSNNEHSAIGNAAIQSAVPGNQQQISSPIQPNVSQPLSYGSLTGAASQPIIIQTPAQRSPDYASSGFSPGAARFAEAPNSRTAPTSNSAQEDNKDIGSGRVFLSTEGDGTAANPPDETTPPKPKPIGKITVNPASSTIQESPIVAGDSTAGSNTRKNEAMAEALAQQGQYKPAGDAYIRALNGAGDETAYIFRQGCLVL